MKKKQFSTDEGIREKNNLDNDVKRFAYSEITAWII